MRRSAFADAAAAGDWAHDSALGASSASEAQGLAVCPSASLSGPLPSPPPPEKQQQQQQRQRGLPSKALTDAFDDKTPERRPPPDSWLRRAWWRGAASGAAAAALALLALVALASSSSSLSSSPSSTAVAPVSPRAHLRGGGFAPRGSFPPPRLLSDDARKVLHPSHASKLGFEARNGARTAAAKKEGKRSVTDEETPLSSPLLSASSPSSSGRTLVSYAYFEKDAVQAANLAFFSAFGMGIAMKEEKGGSGKGGGGRTESERRRLRQRRLRQRRRSPFLPPPPPATDFVVVVSGPSCTPCAMFSSLLAPDARARLPRAPRGISAAWTGVVSAAGAEEEAGAATTEGGPTATTLTLLHRFENDGMDFGAHNVTLEWLAFLEERVGQGRESGSKGLGASPGGDEEETAFTAAAAAASSSSSSRQRHRRLIFLNSSARGPFLPKYLPEGWHWTDAFTRDLDEEGEEEEGEEGAGDSDGEASSAATKTKTKKRVALVGAALTCLPAVDAGGPGPRVESWAFALSRRGLALAKGAGVFGSHGCKLCADGVVVAGEYGLSLAVLRSGRNLATLMSRYGRGIDWSREEHWGCNDNVHPSRHATYDGVDMHPFETLFVKASWHVGEPFVSAYSRWGSRLASSSFPSDDAGDDFDGDDRDGEETSSSFSAGTEGTFDEPRYRYAISPEAQDDWGVAACFGKGAPPLPERKGRGKGKGRKKGDDGGWSVWWQT